MSENMKYIGAHLPLDLVEYIDAAAGRETRNRSKQIVQMLQEARVVRDNIARARSAYGVDMSQPGIPASVPVE